MEGQVLGGGGGSQVTLTAMAWTIIVVVRDWASNNHGVEAYIPLALAQKDTQKVKSNSIRHQETARNTGRERRVHKVRG